MSDDRARAIAARRNADRVVDEATIDEACRHLAAQIDASVGEADPVMLVVMNGGFVPAARILAHMEAAFTVDYLHATRYRNTTQGGRVDWRVRPSTQLQDREVVVIDDILDEGYTLAAIQAALTSAGAARVQTAVLAEKLHDRRCPDVRAEWIGVSVPDRYVFGCGMDLYGYFRQLPAIYAVAEA
ncbi:hypoxanthine-guanine phosphoribosyltransferase [uncultured Abyssibacter sp.]|uniref:hypoxanthine-guanine phosphoribosyltransferase n=1 Tax=uncultured Abyssibacter sp. TaxID=2320202 RepID=UPI0032B28456